MRIVIVDYGAGNLRSVERAVAHCGHEATITSDPAAVEAADVVIVPGVGAAADTMRNLRERALVEPIRSFVSSGRPYLGICMGLQALLTASEEGGEHPCLDILPGRVLRLPDGLKVPHMGWNQVRRPPVSPRLRRHTGRRLLLLRPQLLPGARRRRYRHRRDRLRRHLCQRPCPRQRRRHPVPPGEERRRRPSLLSQLSRMGSP